MNIMDSLPGVLRNWINGLTGLTLSEIEKEEKAWQMTLISMYADGTLTKTESNDAWDTWKRMALDEITYLDAA